LSYRGAIKY